MAVSSGFGCFALILSSVLSCTSSLECHSMVQVDCSPPGPVCDSLRAKLIVTEMTTAVCPVGRTMCASLEASASERGVTLVSTAAGCQAQPTTTTALSVGCYERRALSDVDPAMAKNLADAEEALGIKYDTAEICVCEGDLCNNDGAVSKSPLSDAGNKVNKVNEVNKVNSAEVNSPKLMAVVVSTMLARALAVYNVL